jgi:hypothetical protein
MVIHSGNHEIIGIRHRKTQTLYISDVIEPHSCSSPAYGKIQVGIYISAIQETIARLTQDKGTMEKNPPGDISLKNEEANPNGYFPTKFKKRSRGSGSKGKRQGGHEGNAKRHASGKVVDDQVRIFFLLCQAIVVHDNLYTRF